MAAGRDGDSDIAWPREWQTLLGRQSAGIAARFLILAVALAPSLIWSDRFANSYHHLAVSCSAFVAASLPLGYLTQIASRRRGWTGASASQSPMSNPATSLCYDWPTTVFHLLFCLTVGFSWRYSHG